MKPDHRTTHAAPRFRKRKLRSQASRDEFFDELVEDLARAAERRDWDEYNRIKGILYRAT